MAAPERLTAADLANLTLEAPDSPMHQAALGVLEGGCLLDPAGHVRIDAIRAHVAARLHRVPELRRALHRTRLLEGRPLWVDDPSFDVARHVLVAALPEPGGEEAALAFAGARMSELMDRSHPLWTIWFLEGYGAGRVGVLIKLHHALADGRAMINLVGQLFDLAPEAVTDAPPPWSPEPPPTHGALVRDNLARKRAGLAGVARALRHPLALGSAFAGTIHGAVAGAMRGRGAPRTSLNTPIGFRRRVAVMRVPLGDVKAVARATGTKVNDVFLAVVASAFGAVLRARGERVDGRSLRTSMAVSMHAPGDVAATGNHAGTVLVRLPLDGAGRDGLARVARECADAKSSQQAIVSLDLMLFLARLGVARLYIRRQHMVNVLTTNLPGPPVPLYFAGARLLDAIAMPPIAGNVTVSVAALSYGGMLDLSAIVDADAWPDLDVLVAGMRTAWQALASEVTTVPSREGRPALSA